MRDDEQLRSKTPIVIKGPLGPTQIQEYLTPRCDVTYRTLDSLAVSGVDVFQSLFTGSFIKSSSFANVRFERSDLDGVRAENSRFAACNFTTCDIRSSHFGKCTFDDCVFDFTFIDDCVFSECAFVNCSFKNASISNCIFQHSSLDKCGLSPGTFIHNKLYDSTIANMALADCTVLYVIMRDCTLNNVSLNAEAVGAILGLTKAQVRDANFMFLGKHEEIPSTADVIELIHAEYARRQWLIGKLIASLNFHDESAICAFQRYLTQTYWRFKEAGFAKGDEMRFLSDVIEELATHDELPFLVVLSVLEWCTSVEPLIDKDHAPNVIVGGGPIRLLANRASMLATAMLDKLADAGGDSCFADDPVPRQFRITFNEKPDVLPHVLLNDLVAASPPRSGGATLIRAEYGSYVEYVSATLFSVFAFKVFLFLVNGCIIQITELKHRMKVLTGPGTPRSYAQLALSPRQDATPAVLAVVQALATYTKSLPWINSANAGGFSRENLRSVEEINQGDHAPPVSAP
jgi:uncharacterized protein YjbI with pentapeptide repeats